MTLKGEKPEHVAIIGMVPHSLEQKLGLTPEAEAGLDSMIRMLVIELENLGMKLQKRDDPMTGHWKKEAEYEARNLCA